MAEDQLERLWNELHVRLRRFLCSRLPDDDDAEDILQDIFMRIHDHLETVRDAAKIESWVFQIARNSIVDYYRSRRNHTLLEDDPPVEEAVEEDPAGELLPYLREVVESLPELYREALLLTEYQGLSQVEAAQRLGISISGMKSRVQRARQKVRDVILACCHFEFDVRGVVCCYRERCCCCEMPEIWVDL